MLNQTVKISLIFWMLFMGGMGHAVFGQCNLEQVGLPQYGFGYDVEQVAGETHFEFGLTVDEQSEDGFYGIELWISVGDSLDPATSLELEKNLSGSWAFANAQLSSQLSYDASEGTIHLKILRTDCLGATGTGKVGTLVISGPSLYQVLDVQGGIIMIDNIDAG